MSFRSFFKGIRAEKKAAHEPRKPEPKLSPQEMETKFIFEMAAACNTVPTTKEVLAGTNPGRFEGSREGGKFNTPINATEAATDKAQEDNTSVSVRRKPTVKGPVIAKRENTPDASVEQPQSSIPEAVRNLHTSDFELVRKLGQSQQVDSKVFLSVDAKTDKLFAFKVYPKPSMKPDTYTRVFKEQAVAKKLSSSPWTIKIAGSFEDSKNFYLVTDYHSGGTLADKVENKETNEAALQLMIAEMIAAVEDIHKHGVIHHNLKLDNILIDDDGHLVVTNFGSAFTFTSEEDSKISKKSKIAASSLQAGKDTTTHTAGTPGFMAPEILGEECHSYPVDIFSMGVIAHVLLYGEMPHGDFSRPVEEAYRKPASYKFDLKRSRNTKAAAESLMGMMLEKDPRKRATISELKSHVYFRGINWNVISERSPSEYHKQKVYQYTAPEYMNESDLYPIGEAYEAGDAPCTWYELVAPQLLEPAVRELPTASASDESSMDSHLDSSSVSATTSDTSCSSTASSAPRSPRIFTTGCAFHQSDAPDTPELDRSSSSSPSSSSSSSSSRSSSPRTPTFEALPHVTKTPYTCKNTSPHAHFFCSTPPRPIIRTDGSAYPAPQRVRKTVRFNPVTSVRLFD